MRIRETLLEKRAQAYLGRMGRMTKPLVSTVDHAGTLSLRDKVCERLSQQISFGQIRAGGKLPSCRQLARQLGVSRNTVIAAYQIMKDDGLIYSSAKSGYYVAKDVRAFSKAGLENAVKLKPSIFAAHPLRVRPSSFLVIERPADWSRQPYPFVCNQIDWEEFPLADWRRCSYQSLSRILTSVTTSDHHYSDCTDLTDQILTRLLPRRGIIARPEELLVVSGAQHALYIVATLLGGMGRRIAIEDPGYPDARNIFHSFFGQVIPVPVDAEGIVVNRIPDDLTAVYVTPGQQFPTGVSISSERRAALLAKAEKSGAVILEDDYGAEIDVASAPAATLYASGRSANVLYIGSLSKSISPGLRLGYIVGPADFIREARALRGMMIRHPPPLIQVATAQFIRMGHYDAGIKRMRSLYERRIAALERALAEYLPNARILPRQAGANLSIELSGIDLKGLEVAALGRGVVLDAIEPCYASRPKCLDWLRLGVSAIAERSIPAGVAELKAAMGEWFSRPQISPIAE